MNRRIYIYNGQILIDPENSLFASSILITNGLVTSIDGTEPSEAQKIDLKGGFAMPGLVDSHIHLILASSGQGEVNFSGCRSKADFINLARNLYEHSSQSWLVGYGWSIDNLNELPNSSWIDFIVDKPVVFYSNDFHSALLNKALLSQLDLNEIQSMPGGEAIRNGIVKDDALFNCILPLIPELITSKKILATLNGIQYLHSKGITSVGTMESLAELNEVLLPIQDKNLIRCRVMLLDEPTDSTLKLLNEFQNTDFLDVTGFKSFIDGSLGSRTAKMYRSWCDAEGAGEWAGHKSRGELDDWVKRVSSLNYSPIIHAIGDEGVGEALRVLRDNAQHLFGRIEHAQFIDQEDIDKISGQWFGVQPLHLIDDIPIAKTAVEESKASEMLNFRRMLDSGALLSFGSDWPVAPPNALEAIQIAVLNGLTVQEALMASTINGGKSLRSNNIGHLNIGAYGDVVLLDTSPFECNWNNDIPVVKMTIVGGKIVHTPIQNDE